MENYIEKRIELLEKMVEHYWEKSEFYSNQGCTEDSKILEYKYFGYYMGLQMALQLIDDTEEEYWYNKYKARYDK